MTDTVAGNEEVKEPQEEIVQEVVQEEAAPVEEESSTFEPVAEEARDKQVPLSALVKERRKRQEVEQENKAYRDLNIKKLREEAAPAEEEDGSQYEPVTKADFKKEKFGMMQAMEENQWIKHNPEKAQIVNEKLTDFLNTKPHLKAALNQCVNRYEEAWDWLEKYTEKPKAPVKQSPVRREAPGSPSAVPKGAGLNQSIDLMGMNDSDFNAWRSSQRKRR